MAGAMEKSFEMLDFLNVSHRAVREFSAPPREIGAVTIG